MDKETTYKTWTHSPKCAPAYQRTLLLSFITIMLVIILGGIAGCEVTYRNDMLGKLVFCLTVFLAMGVFFFWSKVSKSQTEKYATITKAFINVDNEGLYIVDTTNIDFLRWAGMLKFALGMELKPVDIKNNQRLRRVILQKVRERRLADYVVEKEMLHSLCQKIYDFGQIKEHKTYISVECVIGKMNSKKKQTICIYKDIDNYDSLRACIDIYINSEKWNHRCPTCGGVLEQESKCVVCGK